MRQYFAATETDTFLDILEKCKARYILTSYFWLSKKRDFKALKERGFTIFIDSGGFSARESGKFIDIKEYRDFLVKNKDYIEIGANYDVGTTVQQLKNQEFLEEEFPVIPVYHLDQFVNNERKLLDYYIDKYKYIALGGMVGEYANEKNITIFLNYCFSKGLPKKIKFHGFGINNSKRLIKYPFYSIDSSNWIKGGQFGIMNKWEKYIMKSGLSYKDINQMLDYSLPITLMDNYFNRLEYNAMQYLEMEKDITELWESRGIKYI